MDDVFSALLARGVSLFGQGDRLLRLRLAAGRGFSEATLLPHRLHGEEGLSVNYRYDLECLSANAHLELKTLLGQPVEVGLLLPDGGERLLTGLVTRAEQLGADGGFARYRLTIEPALATLAHRRNSRVYQDKSVPAIVEALLTEHRERNPAFLASFTWRNDLTQTYPVRSYCLQYRESDLAFITRLLAEEGISWRYTHGPDPDTAPPGEAGARAGGGAARQRTAGRHSAHLARHRPGSGGAGGAGPGRGLPGTAGGALAPAVRRLLGGGGPGRTGGAAPSAP
jgi:type VI secretion system secreted protein VgrG